MDSAASAEMLAQVSLELLESAGEISLKLRGNCMWPFLRDSDIVTVRKFPFEKLRRGDAAIFKTTPRTFHANVLFNRWDPKTTSQEAYLGKVVAVQRKDKTILMDERSALEKFWQYLLAPANPYFLGFPVYLRKLFQDSSK